ncbi:MAG: asparaginyl/glutamyl-tRNA amidotransferase subunit C [Candidatus Firestonebacteria bacterium RIFOXYC2_FULL_39_67]|nr:MAG: asparaginyl/glutamyl-tRNA amidotransferase subunit C [Candidatus Firestonebacteria bacterium RIFOXYD2_FULL_39_29]OGF53925.1 MAG: asparaginyl/glutamyl-tRNA amidotransferase subunit C [Candidatus Firestonebacteria bacterium RIFOXYC2_FULL_39_67]
MISKKDVLHVAKLSHLKFEEKDLDKFALQLEGMIEFVDKLKEVNTDGIEPTSSVIPVTNVMREDELKPSFSREKALSNAPEKELGHYKIPKMME